MDSRAIWTFDMIDVELGPARCVYYKCRLLFESFAPWGMGPGRLFLQ